MNHRYIPIQDANPLDPQGLTLQALRVLQGFQPRWAGCLILGVGLGPQGSALAFAANIAGAACLVVDDREDLCRAAMRSGAADFLVNDLAEALRILKNEIRKGLPCSVAVRTAPLDALAELMERGVLPELCSLCDLPIPVALRERMVRGWASRGCHIVHLPMANEVAANGMEEHTFAFDSALEVKAFDQGIQALLPVDDPRQKWLKAAPRLFARSRTRTVDLKPTELAELHRS